ncbi:unnamed protein product [Thelazia callipaeda]|uniref:Transposase n=1 Tax=Thelazia callipaeda TaxID=103827 RepID=A0A0N5D1Z1_THECL|nr:unnamed protein product [Thelazia callipaeda]
MVNLYQFRRISNNLLTVKLLASLYQILLKKNVDHLIA